MKKTTKKILTIAFASIVSAALLTGCGGSSGQTDIQVYGSTSVEPLAQVLSQDYTNKNNEVNITVQGIGSTEGIQAVQNGTTDIGSSSRELTPEEKGSGITEYTIALDGIAVIVHPNNTISNLTQQNITDIFSGKIKNWKDIGGQDKAITVFTRESGSGTRGAFEELMKLLEKQEDGTKKSLITATAQSSSSTGAIKTAVAQDEASIGYISLAVLDDTVKGLKIDNVAPTIENIKNKTYTLQRPFLFLTKGDVKPETKAFIDYCLSDAGQKIVTDDHYISIK